MGAHIVDLPKLDFSWCGDFCSGHTSPLRSRDISALMALFAQEVSRGAGAVAERRYLENMFC